MIALACIGIWVGLGFYFLMKPMIDDHCKFVAEMNERMAERQERREDRREPREASNE